MIQNRANAYIVAATGKFFARVATEKARLPPLIPIRENAWTALGRDEEPAINVAVLAGDKRKPKLN